MSIIENLNKIESELAEELKKFEDPAFKESFEAIKNACLTIGQAWSGGWLGYHAYIYKSDFKPARPGEFFDIEWGADNSFLANKTHGDWSEFNHAIVAEKILSLAGYNLDYLKKVSDDASKRFNEAKEDLIILIEASSFSVDQFIINQMKEIKSITSHVSKESFTSIRRPQQMTRDSKAVSGGYKTPPHIFIESFIFEYASYSTQCEALMKITRTVRKYIFSKSLAVSLPKESIPNTKKIFIGHGRSLDWKILADFLKDRLGLDPSEFNSIPTAGLHTAERLDQLLNESAFAFIIMTAEDSQADGTTRARENVVHEIGLFQGKLGRKKAIILLEEGCNEFSNIVGLVQIRFPKGKILYCAEEIRQVLEREHII